MKPTETDLLDWGRRYGAERACIRALAQQRWQEGCRCPRSGHDRGYAITTPHRYECPSCRYRALVTAETLFHSTNLPLGKWFRAIYLTAPDKGGVSAGRLGKQIGVSWITAKRMLRKIRIAIGHRGSIDRLHGLTEIYDALAGGRRSGKRGRCAEGKGPVLVAMENRDGRTGFITMQQVSAVTRESVAKSIQRRLPPSQSVGRPGMGKCGRAPVRLQRKRSTRTVFAHCRRSDARRVPLYACQRPARESALQPGKRSPHKRWPHAHGSACDADQT